MRWHFAKGLSPFTPRISHTSETNYVAILARIMTIFLIMIFDLIGVSYKSSTTRSLTYHNRCLLSHVCCNCIEVCAIIPKAVLEFLFFCHRPVARWSLTLTLAV